MFIAGIFNLGGIEKIVNPSEFDFNSPSPRGLVHITGPGSPAHTPDGSSYGYWWVYSSPGIGDVIQFAISLSNPNVIWFRCGRFSVSEWGNITVNVIQREGRARALLYSIIVSKKPIYHPIFSL